MRFAASQPYGLCEEATRAPGSLSGSREGPPGILRATRRRRGPGWPPRPASSPLWHHQRDKHTMQGIQERPRSLAALGMTESLDPRRDLFAEHLHLVDQLLHRVGGEVEAEEMRDAGLAEGDGLVDDLLRRAD